MGTIPAIGIDLGTTFSCVAVWQNGKVEIIPNDQGNRTTPSYVAFTETERVLGDAAKNQVARNPSNTVFDAKRMIGRKYDDPKLQQDLQHWPFKVVNENGKPKIQVEYKGSAKKLAAEEISSMVLTKMKQTAEAYLGCSVSKAVVTVPAYFNDSQRQATKDVGHIAGLSVVQIVNEPTAAAIAYCLEKNLKEERNVVIFSLGGGYFDVSILTIDDEGMMFTVKATAGDTHLGGEDFDSRLVNYLAEEFSRKFKKDLKSNPKALRRLRTAAEKAKRTLSCTTEAPVEIDALLEGIDFYTKISRAVFEELNSDLFKNTMLLVSKALSEAKMDKAMIHDVVLAGGSTRIPKIQQLLQKFFDGKPLNQTVNPDEAAAYGAAVRAAVMNCETDPKIQELHLIEVAPHSLGFETAEGVMEKIFERNSQIPCKKIEMYTTASDSQTAVCVRVYEGEEALAKNNNLLGTFDLIGIKSEPRGQAEIEVVYVLDISCILTVTARDFHSGNEHTITIDKHMGCLSPEDIYRMLEEAQEYKREEEELQKKRNAKNSLEASILELKQEVSGCDDRFTPKEKSDILMELDVWLQWLDAPTSNLEEETVYSEVERRLVAKYRPIIANL